MQNMNANSWHGIRLSMPYPLVSHNWWELIVIDVNYSCILGKVSTSLGIQIFLSKIKAIHYSSSHPFFETVGISLNSVVHNYTFFPLQSKWFSCIVSLGIRLLELYYIFKQQFILSNITFQVIKFSFFLYYF